MKLRKSIDPSIIDKFIEAKLVYYNQSFYIEQKFLLNITALAEVMRDPPTNDSRKAPLCEFVNCSFNSGIHCELVLGFKPSCRHTYNTGIVTRYIKVDSLFLASKIKYFEL